MQIDSSTIDGNVVFVQSQYSCIFTILTSFPCPIGLSLRLLYAIKFHNVQRNVSNVNTFDEHYRNES